MQSSRSSKEIIFLEDVFLDLAGYFISKAGGRILLDDLLDLLTHAEMEVHSSQKIPLFTISHSTVNSSSGKERRTTTENLTRYQIDLIKRRFKYEPSQDLVMSNMSLPESNIRNFPKPIMAIIKSIL